MAVSVDHLKSEQHRAVAISLNLKPCENGDGRRETPERAELK
jgi:hypothetical protein